MKRFLLMATLFLGLASVGMAQTKEKAKTAPAKTQATAKAPAAKSTQATTAKTTAAPAKKDGTPDMRYKQNKAVAKADTTAKVHAKADGTPDKRYKENKKKG